MGDMGEFWRDVKEADKERKERNLNRAEKSKTDWKKHTQYHWSITLNGSRLDYWPSRNKFQYQGRVMTGDVEGFIRKREKK